MTTKTLGTSLREPAMEGCWRNKWYPSMFRAKPVLELVKLCVEAFRRERITEDLDCGLKYVKKNES